MKRCTLCLSTNIRRSGLHVAALRAHPLQSPYRCADCDSRYWVVNRAARLTAIAGVCAGMAFALAAAPSLLDVRGPPSTPRFAWVGAQEADGLAPAVYVVTPEAARSGSRQALDSPPLSWPVQVAPGIERMD